MDHGLEMDKRFAHIWAKGNYRLGSAAERLVPFFKEVIPAGAVVNDYGSGTGRAAKGLLEFCSQVHMVDFLDEALEADARSMLGDRLTYTVAPLEQLPDDFPHADWGLCIGVLMLIDPSVLNSILGNIRRTCDNLIVAVYDRPDVRLGIDLTTIKQSSLWWRETLGEFWPSVEILRGREASNKHLHMCRS